MIATGGEVFGSCVGEIDVSVLVKYGEACLCCGWKYLGFILARKAFQYLRWKREMVPGIGYCFGCFWRVLRNKSPCGGRGGGGIILPQTPKFLGQTITI